MTTNKYISESRKIEAQEERVRYRLERSVVASLREDLLPARRALRKGPGSADTARLAITVVLASDATSSQLGQSSSSETECVQRIERGLMMPNATKELPVHGYGIWAGHGWIGELVRGSLSRYPMRTTLATRLRTQVSKMLISKESVRALDCCP